MRKLFTILLSCICLLSLFSGCEVSKPEKVEKEIVLAVVMNSGHGRGGDWIQVAYNGDIVSWNNKKLYNYYNTRHGANIQCVLVTYTYESGRTKKYLLYNEDLDLAYRNNLEEVK